MTRRKMADKRTRSDDKDERVTLAPLDPETALRALLAVKPDADAEDDKVPEKVEGEAV